LTAQLPGEKAHIPLLPSGRKVSSEVRHRAINPIPSAVAIQIVMEETNYILKTIQITTVLKVNLS